LGYFGSFLLRLVRAPTVTVTVGAFVSVPIKFGYMIVLRDRERICYLRLDGKLRERQQLGLSRRFPVDRMPI